MAIYRVDKLVVIVLFLTLTCFPYGQRVAADEAKSNTNAARLKSDAGEDNANNVNAKKTNRPGLIPGVLPDSANDRGIAFAEKEQYDLAIKEFTKAIEIHPFDAEAFNNRGIIYSKKGRYDLALADFSRAINLNRPDSPIYYYNRGLAYVKADKFSLALEDFSKSIEINPINASALKARGDTAVKLACSDWLQACKIGDCLQMKEAKKMGLCAELIKQNY